jgi:integrase
MQLLAVLSGQSVGRALSETDSQDVQDTLTEAKAWRQDAAGALRAGTLRAPFPITLRAAGLALVAGMKDGAILDRSGKPYKPSTCRGYEVSLNKHVLPQIGDKRLTELHRRDLQAVVERWPKDGLSPSSIANALDPVRVIFRRALRDDVVSVDPTDGLELPSVRGKRDRIESTEVAHTLLAALPDSERALWAVALFAGLRRGELRALRWTSIDFDAGVIRVERSWDPVEREIDVKSEAGRRAVPMALVVRRELTAHKTRTARDGEDLVFGRTPREPFIPSTVRTHANAAWTATKLTPLTLHEARHCAISYFIAAGLDWKQISTWAGHGDVRQTWNRYGHLVPGDEEQAAERLSRYLGGPIVAPVVAHSPESAETPAVVTPISYRYRDSNPGFRRERAAS